MESKSTIKGGKRVLLYRRCRNSPLVSDSKLKCIMKKKKKKKNMRRLFDRKGNEFNVWESQGKHTHAANTNMERGDQLTEMSPHNKYDGTRILGHE